MKVKRALDESDSKKTHKSAQTKFNGECSKLLWNRCEWHDVYRKFNHREPFFICVDDPKNERIKIQNVAVEERLELSSLCFDITKVVSGIFMTFYIARYTHECHSITPQYFPKKHCECSHPLIANDLISDFIFFIRSQVNVSEWLEFIKMCTQRTPRTNIKNKWKSRRSSLDIWARVCIVCARRNKCTVNTRGAAAEKLRT